LSHLVSRDRSGSLGTVGLFEDGKCCFPVDDTGFEHLGDGRAFLLDAPFRPRIGFGGPGIGGRIVRFDFRQRRRQCVELVESRPEAVPCGEPLDCPFDLPPVCRFLDVVIERGAVEFEIQRL